MKIFGNRKRENSLYTKAQLLNQELNQEIESISSSELQVFTQRLTDGCKALSYTSEYTQAWYGHRYRLYLSIEWIKETLALMGKSEIIALETGGYSVVTDLIKQAFPVVSWSNTQGDLRYNWGYPDEYADLIVCMEVLEHVSDFPDGYQDSFLKTGLRAMLKEVYRVLKPQGCFFITTPNAASIVQLSSILAGYSPWFYQLHVREYSLNELVPEIEEAGFKIAKLQTIQCLTYDTKNDYSKVFRLLVEGNFEARNRGDDIFIIAKKT